MFRHDIIYLSSERLTAAFLAGALEPYRLRVRRADSLATLGALVAEAEPDVILVDCLLPADSGLRVLAHLRRVRLLTEMPIILLCPPDRETRNSTISEALRHGATDVIFTPIDVVLFHAKLEVLFRLRNLTRERARLLSHLNTDWRESLEMLISHARLLLDPPATYRMGPLQFESAQSIHDLAHKLLAEFEQTAIYGYRNASAPREEPAECETAGILGEVLGEVERSDRSLHHRISVEATSDGIPVLIQRQPTAQAIARLLLLLGHSMTTLNGKGSLSIRPQTSQAHAGWRIDVSGTTLRPEDLTMLTTPVEGRDESDLTGLRELIESVAGQISILMAGPEALSISIMLPLSRRASS